MAIQDAVTFDLYDRATYAAPYETFRRLRDEAPLYFNQERNYYAVSRFDDTVRVLVDRDTFSSAKGATFSVLPHVLSGAVQLPPCLFIAEDPPLHAIHRALVWRVFTPKTVNMLESQIRDFCVRTLDELVGARRFDYAHDLAHRIPMRVIGMMLGVPEADQPMLHAHFHAQMNDESVNRSEPVFEALQRSEELFGEYLDWREANPADDLMSDLLHAELDDGSGTKRRLTRDEIFVYVNMLGAAGSDTTSRLMEWTAKVLAEHPDQRGELVADPSLIPNAIEEVLRFEPPSYVFCRFVVRDVELHREVVPSGSVVAVMPGSANRDERTFAGPDAFDVHRDLPRIMSFGFGPHVCVGANLARLEGRILLEEVLARFPEWTVDLDDAQMTLALDTRGWESLPVCVSDR
jgi:cytochrome P450